MMMRGRVWRFGDDVDTDVIIPARYLNTSEPEELAIHVMEGVEFGFSSKVKKGDIIVAGENFGCGSSREHAPIAIKGAGISCVIGKSFARIFYRNAINIGLPIAESREVVEETSEGDILEVNFTTGKIKNLTTGKAYSFSPFPDFVMKLIESGGLVEYTKRRLKSKEAKSYEKSGGNTG